ncbi:MAG: hypothetical protein WBE05_03985 [Pseudolabrys sp.]|jgi:hypothetical protein
MRSTLRLEIASPNPVPPNFRVGTVSLLEVKKDTGNVFVFQTDSAVAHFKANFIFVIALLGDDRHTTLFRKLDRVADKIEQYLSQPRDVADQLKRETFVDI